MRQRGVANSELALRQVEESLTRSIEIHTDRTNSYVSSPHYRVRKRWALKREPRKMR